MEREAKQWIQRLARAGYLAKAVVYVLVGGLAVQAAFGNGRTEDSSGALRTVLEAPFGRVLLALIAVGLVGYALWRAYAAVANPEHDKAHERAYFGLTALLHAGLAVEAFRLALGQGGGGGGESAAHWSARLLSQPFGPVLLGAVGALIAAFGLAQLVRAWKSKLDEQLALGELEAGTRSWVVAVSRFGLAARGVVFALIGIFTLRAALQYDPSEAEGVGGVLASLRDQPALLAAVAAGLIAYGIYEVVRARYRVIRTDDGGSRGTQLKLERI